MILPDTVTVVVPTAGVDGRGDPVLSYGDDATRSDVLAAMQQGLGPRGAAETLGDRDQQESRWTVYSESTPDLTALDQIEWNDLTFQVDGHPNHLEPRGIYHHTEANLRLVEG